MKHGIKIFEHEQFGKLRIIVIDGVIWFVGIDVAHALGYSNPQRAIRDYVDDTDKRVEKIGTAGGYQKTTLINKSGVYSLILDSNMPKAKEYRHWVTSDVLPQVDETGSYSAVTPSPMLVANSVDTKMDEARVYVLRMSDDTVQVVKIGQSKNIRSRVAKIKRDTGLTVIDMYFTSLMPRNIARLVEWACQEVFSSWRIKGEFFSVEFSEVCAKVNYFLELATAAPITIDFEHDEKSFKIADKDKV